MDRALKEAEQAVNRGEVPVGAVIVQNGEIIAAAGNRMQELNDATAHAEILAIRAASRSIDNARLTECDLYVTLEPCVMCAGAISFARLRRVYFAAEDIKGGAIENGVRFFGDPSCHHVPDVYSGLGETSARALLTGFFQKLR